MADSIKCKYYPCHLGAPSDFSCEFCYCPEYNIRQCSGTPRWCEVAGKMIKDCSACILPHTHDYVQQHYKEAVANNYRSRI